MAKKCFKCEVEKSFDEFYKHPRMGDGYLGKCKECAKKDVHENYCKQRLKYQDYERKRSQRPERKAAALTYQRHRRRQFPHKDRARDAVAKAIRDGRLVRQPCEICGNAKSEAHHDDYYKPLDVRWLCFVHHREHHGQEAMPMPEKKAA